MRIKKYLWILLSILAIAGCESLEDTYSDYAGDGAIRYVGKCSDVSVSPGWERLIVKWVNNPDTRIDKIKVKWDLDGVQDSLLLDPDKTECNIPNLKEGNYEVTVCSVDKDGNQSLSTPLFCRPYTATHETILSFTRLISKHYFVKNRLVLLFSTWSDKIESATLNYYSNGALKSLALNKSLLNQKYYLVPESIDPGTIVTLHRKGWVEGCEDLITFKTYEFSTERLYSSDFKQLVRTQYGLSEITDAFADAQEELEVDYTITSFDDILNFPNLKKLILGKNRFLNDTYLSLYSSDSKLYEREKSLFALNIAHDILGLTIERYNQHFLPGETLPYMSEMGNPTVPAISFLDNSEWKVTNNPEDEGSYLSHPENLFDGNFATLWQPERSTAPRTHEITVDMTELKTISGVQLTQSRFNPYDGTDSKEWASGVIKIKASTDQSVWQDVTYVEEIIIGATSGEISIINFSSPLDVRYLKFIVSDLPYGKLFSVTLAEIGVF